MCNFFAQADAPPRQDGRAAPPENVPDLLIPHKTFTGNRPSLSIMLPALNAYTTGQLLALYEHRAAVQGFVWGVNSFDQWGVELGKVLASKVRSSMNQKRTKGEKMSDSDGFNPSTTAMLTGTSREGAAQVRRARGCIPVRPHRLGRVPPAHLLRVSAREDERERYCRCERERNTNERVTRCRVAARVRTRDAGGGARRGIGGPGRGRERTSRRRRGRRERGGWVKRRRGARGAPRAQCMSRLVVLK